MTKVYSGLGFQCMYPENWSVIEDATDEGKVSSFTMESPTSAFMTVSEYPWSVPPREALEQSSDAMQEEYEEVEEELYVPSLSLRGEPMNECYGLDLRFYYLDLLVVSRFVAFTMDHRTFLVQIQAESRDFDLLEKVFEAMLVSMLQSVGPETPQD